MNYKTLLRTIYIPLLLGFALGMTFFLGAIYYCENGGGRLDFKESKCIGNLQVDHAQLDVLENSKDWIKNFTRLINGSN